VLKGVHVFHCWLGCAQVIEIHEVRGWLSQLADRISRFHVRIAATSRADAHRTTCVGLATQVRTSHAPLCISDADKIALSVAKLENVRCVRISAPLPFCTSRDLCPCEAGNKRLICHARHPMVLLLAPSFRLAMIGHARYSVVFQNGYTTILTAHALLTV
jgi:hypothetical protein